MAHGTLRKRLGRGLSVALVLVGIGPISVARAQLLYSFEPDLEGWGPTGFDGSDLISVAHSTLGATDGTHSMAVERGNAIGTTNPHSWDVGRTVTPTVLPQIYSIFQSIAANPDGYALDFDVTFTPESFAEVGAVGAFFAINLSANSGTAGFDNWNQHDTLVPEDESTANLIGTDAMGNFVPKLGTHHYSIPLATARGEAGLWIAPDATYYQLNIGSNLNNGTFMNGPNGEGAVYFVDNIRFRALPETVEETIFSWETPDNPNTPEINEQFEGWFGGNFGPNSPPHEHAITTTGATHGSYAFEINRNTPEGVNDSLFGDGFTWGSLFTLVADTNPDPEVEEIDPAIQARITELITKIEAAEAVAFDVTYQYQDLFPTPDPTYTHFAVHFSDETGVFYQRSGQNIDVVSATEPSTVTVEIPLDQFVDANTGTLNLKTNGFVDDSGFFRIGIATGTNGPQIYQIDNFRLISLAPVGLEGDYNDDGEVNAADYVVWRKNVGTTNTLPNDPHGGTIGTDQYDTWKANFGATTGGGSLASAAVPEPASASLLLFAAVAVTFGRRRRRT